MQWPRYLGDRHASLRLIFTIVLILLADIGHVLVNETMYSLKRSEMPLGQTIFFQSVLILVLCVAAIGIKNPQILSTEYMLHPQNRQIWYRGISNSLSFIFLFVSLRYISIDEALSILHIRSLPIALLCWSYAKDRFSGLQCVLSLLSLLGVWSISQPEFAFPPHPALEGGVWGGSMRFLGFGLMLLSLMASCVDYTFTRRIGTAVDILPSLATSSVCGAVTGLGMIVLSGGGFHAAGKQQALMLLMLSAAMFLWQYTLIWAIRRESAAKIATLGHLQVVGSVIFHRWLIARLPPFSLVMRMVFMLATALVSAILGAGLRPNPGNATEVELASLHTSV